MALTLTLTGGPQLQRHDFVRPEERVTLLARGAFSVEAVLSKDCLVFSQHAQQPMLFECSSEVKPFVEGVELRRGALEAGQVLTWRQLTVTVEKLEEPAEDEQAMIDLGRQSNSALSVYADWLESRGELELASWARLMLSPPSELRTMKLAALASAVGAADRARLARGPIERCARACKGSWEALELGAPSWQRSCGRCGELVSYCATMVEVHRERGPVVIDPAIVRHPGDLDVPVIWLG